jgi:hypothetical protein
VTALLAFWKGAKRYYTLCALLPRMKEPMVERPTLYGGGHIVNEVSVNVTSLCVLQLGRSRGDHSCNCGECLAFANFSLRKYKLESDFCIVSFNNF